LPYKGTGLGLAIAIGIANAQGGSIWVTSVIDDGSCFYFTLPRYVTTFEIKYERTRRFRYDVALF
jgi:signal transduction histidine kinase